jgi:hypothetical protein
MNKRKKAAHKSPFCFYELPIKMCKKGARQIAIKATCYAPHSKVPIIALIRLHGRRSVRTLICLSI